MYTFTEYLLEKAENKNIVLKLSKTMFVNASLAN